MKIDSIERVLDEKVRPALKRDSGDISVTSWDEETGELTVRFLGACSGCPAQQQTVEGIVEKELMEALPEVKKITLDTSVDPELLDMARKILNHEI